MRQFLTIMLVFGTLSSPSAFASDASGHFSIFVPPANDDNGSDSLLVVTAMQNDTFVTIEDTGEDGDVDDSTEGALRRGQSIVIAIGEGAINDDAGGVWDGDRFLIDANAPVIAMLATKSDWQHDWVPSGKSNMRRKQFYVYSPVDGWDIDIVSYEDDTVVEIMDITVNPTLGSGTTSVRNRGEIVLRQTLNEGEDLLVSRNGSGTNLTEAGHTYRVIASQAVTMLYGSLSETERDGGGYAVGERGGTMDKHFYLPVPAGQWTSHERELRIARGEFDEEDEGTGIVTLRGWTQADGWVDLDTRDIPPFGHIDYTGRTLPALADYALFEVDADVDVSVLEANWIDGGSPGVSDFFSFVPPIHNTSATDVGRDFIAYVGAPGDQSQTSNVAGKASHLFFTAANPNTRVTITDLDTGGSLINEQIVIASRDDVFDFQLTEEQFALINDDVTGTEPYLLVDSNRPISVGTTNWNNDWLAFASGVEPPHLRARWQGPEEVACNTEIEYTLTVSNVGVDDLIDVTISLNPRGLTLLNSIPEVLDRLDVDTAQSFEVLATFPCAGHSTGEVLRIGSSLRGIREPTGSFVCAGGSASSRSLVPGVVGIGNVTGFGDECAVEVAWTTNEDDGNSSFGIERREFRGEEDYVEIGRVNSLAPQTSGFVYGFRDVQAEQGARYQYRVKAYDLDSNEELTVAGPMVASAGLPFTEVPGTTGDLFADYDGVGVIMADPVSDMEGPTGVLDGYDVDAIGVAYDPIHDALYLAASAVGVFGDADGNGNADTTGAGAQVEDAPRFSGTEQFAFVLDFDGGDEGDAVVGIPFGADIDFITATNANEAIASIAPVLAFTMPTDEQLTELVVSVLNYPSAARPDLEIVVYNASSLNEGVALNDIRTSFYVAAPDVTESVEWAPTNRMATFPAAAMATPGCGQPAEEIHLGMFAAFGNLFSGAPRFDFIPLGWEDNIAGETIADAPVPVVGQVITSPTVFLADQQVDITATVAPNFIELPERLVEVRDNGMVRGDTYVHTTEMTWQFSAETAPDRYENLDIQAFRMFVLDCSATAVTTQYGTSGVLRDDRFIRLGDQSVARLGNINPALILAHSGFGTFEVGGALRPLHWAIPEDWVTEFGPETSPEFTHYAFLNDVTYIGNGPSPDTTEVYPLTQQGVELQPGIWFINHYMWSYANDGDSRIETVFTPGPDCGGSL